MSDPREMIKKFPLEPHHELRETFADGLGTMLFDGNTLRLEFTAARMEEPKPPHMPTGKRHVVARVVLSAPGAIDLINQLQMVAAQLTAAGILKPQPTPASTPSKPN